MIPGLLYPEISYQRSSSIWARQFVRLDGNFFGHKLARLLWQKFAEGVNINELHLDRVQGWECLYYHTEQKLFLSVYVDDLKMAGKQENLAPMWKEMGGYLELEPAGKMAASQY